jgi:hypothetical protein
MTTKLLASGVAAVAAIGAAATGMTPVAIASTGPEGTPGAHHAMPITRGPSPQAPDSDSPEDSEAPQGTQTSEARDAAEVPGPAEVPALKKSTIFFIPDYGSGRSTPESTPSPGSDSWPTAGEPESVESSQSTPESLSSPKSDKSLTADEPESGQSTPAEVVDFRSDDEWSIISVSQSTEGMPSRPESEGFPPEG